MDSLFEKNDNAIYLVTYYILLLLTIHFEYFIN